MQSSPFYQNRKPPFELRNAVTKGGFHGAANRARTGTELPQADFKCEKIAQHWGPVPAWNCPKFIWFFWKIII